MKGIQRPLEITFRKQNFQTANYIPEGKTDIQMEHLSNHPRLSEFFKTFQPRRFSEQFCHIAVTHINSSREPVKMAPLSASNHRIIHGETVTSALLEMLQNCVSVLLMVAADLQAFLLYSRQINGIALLLRNSVVTSICPTGT